MSEDKKALLKKNARGSGWKRDGLNSASFEVVDGTERPLRVVGSESESDGGSGGASNAPSSSSSSPPSSSHLRGVHVTVNLLAGIDDLLTCVECGVAKPPSGFATHQYRKAMFWVKRAGEAHAVGQGECGDSKTEACHWDDRGSSSVQGQDAGEAPSPDGKDEEEGERQRAAKDKSWKHSARCLSCVEKDPRVIEFKRCAARNQTDATRVTCTACGEAFGSRTKLFKHLDASGHGAQVE